MKKVFKFFSSLKLAVIVIFSITAALITATFLESGYDTPTAQYYVYHSWQFSALLGLFAINIFCSAMSRLPWKMRHAPFLLAHLGILTLLAGSWVTQKFGLDGNLRITEGETTSVVELDNNALMVIDKSNIKRIPLEWLPPSAHFSQIRLLDRGLPFDLTIDQYLTHAEPIYNFVEETQTSPAMLASGKPAVQVNLKGGPMQISQDFWLWGGDPGWSSVQAGPALLKLEVPGLERDRPSPGSSKTNSLGHPTLSIQPLPTGVSFLATSSEGKELKGKLSTQEISEAKVINPGWKNVSITFKKYFLRSIPQTTYKNSRIQYGQGAPTSAIHLVSGKGGEGSEIWLGLGERAVLEVSGKEIELGYFPQRVILPFALRLDKFKVDHYDGTRDPSSYSSEVTVLGDQAGIEKRQDSSSVISMNEPLHFKGNTLYQASYEDAEPRPIVSILAVNRDPGRFWKYLGSLLIVCGSVLLFASRYTSKKKSARPSPTPEGVLK